MTSSWTKEDIDGGVFVAQQNSSGRYNHPMVISWREQEPNTRYGLTDLRDGMFICIGSKEKLAQHLTAAGYVLVPKFIFRETADLKSYENRLGLPVVVMAHISS